MRSNTFLMIVITMMCSYSFVFSQSDESVLPDKYIGMTPDEAWNTFGAPTHLFSHRGDNESEDDVVFYRNGLYLYWFQNRVWQVRADRNFNNVLAGVHIGDSVEMILAKYPEYLTKTPEMLITEIDRDVYPLRLRLSFNEKGEVDDIYLYRGDF